MTTPAPSAPTPPQPTSPLVLLTAAFYLLFTLLPDSSSQMVAWPWVFLWQVACICPILWLLSSLWQRRQFPCLGNGLDWVVALGVAGLLIATAIAEFPNQARWYTTSVLGAIAALYALNGWLETPQRQYRLLLGQGYLNLAFIGVSLLLWLGQTLLPELSRLQQLNQQYGANLAFDFSAIELRNWAPIGHQNYVAGYLVLAVPLLVGLGLSQKGWQRWLWWGGAGLGLIDLYTTSSRGGWLGLAVAVGVGLCLSLFLGLGRNAVPRLWLVLGGAGAIVLLGSAVLFNPRLRSILQALASGHVQGELAYRLITTATGWRMGIQHPLVGVGPGGVSLLFQHYRPIWAGREAELAYQLHSTPIQLWAELGAWGLIVLLWSAGWLVWQAWRWRQLHPWGFPAPLVWSLLVGLLAYGVQSLTDYQLDNVSISGTLVIFLAVLAAVWRKAARGEAATDRRPQRSTRLPAAIPLAGAGVLVAGIVWLVPIHRAWMLSSQGFLALSQVEAAQPLEERQAAIATFQQRLEQAHQLAPWEPYYSYQLGWNLGNLFLQTGNRAYLDPAIAWFRQGIKTSPYQEFGHTNLGWLLAGQDPKAAAQAFVAAAQLFPAKRGVFYGLGTSLLALQQQEAGLEALTLELVRDPLFITSPIWQTAQSQPLYAQLLKRVQQKYDQLLQQDAQPGSFNTYLHQVRGALAWWQGDRAAAHQHLDAHGSELALAVLDLADRKPVQPRLPALMASPEGVAIAAWLNPGDRARLLAQAWLLATRQEPPPDLLTQLVQGMERSATFDQWLKQAAPTRQVRRERSGFGVLNRHIDGPLPNDFLVVVDNVAMTQLFDALIPSLGYNPDLDRAIRPWQDKLLQQVARLIPE